MALTTRAGIQQEFAKGNGHWYPVQYASAAAVTAAGNGSNNINFILNFNNIGTTLPSTLQAVPLPPSPPRDLIPMLFNIASSTNRGIVLAWLYQIGTVNLAATGDQFTHAAGITFPILRTKYGVASQPITLIPILYITTATTSSAPAFVLEASGGGTGYVDQDGNNVDGSVTFTCPAAATAVQGAYIPRLETGDVGIRDIVQINVTTAGMAGAADLWGMELICAVGNLLNFGPWSDPIFGGFGPHYMTPGVATSGTVTSKLCIVGWEDAASLPNPTGVIAAAMNTA